MVTPVVVSHTFTNGDGTPASGTIEFQLSGRLTNGTTTILPTPVMANLDATGSFNQSLAATDDSGSTPGVTWQVTLRLYGMSPETWLIELPHANTTADLGSLLPAQEQVG